MKQYLDLVRHIMDNGNDRGDRTGTGTRSIFGHQMRFDLADGFPLVTTKKTNYKAVFHELLWFLSGSTNIKYLQENGIRIWDEWADEFGEVGPMYGSQWRKWGDGRFKGPGAGGIDQLQNVIDILRTDPESRRMVVSAWNVDELDSMALNPCHVLFQFYVSDYRLHMYAFQRSADVFLGLPFNIASYAALLTMVAKVVGLEPGELVYSIGDAHLYNNHKDQVAELLTREPKELPTLTLTGGLQGIDDYNFDHLVLSNYDSHPFIKAPVAV